MSDKPANANSTPRHRHLSSVLTFKGEAGSICDMADRHERARNRVISRLCLAANRDFDGLTRSDLARAADSNNYRRGTADIEQMITDGDIEPNPDNPKKLRLTLATIDEVAYSEDRQLVSEFFNLDKPYARRLRLQRIARNGDDILLPSRYDDPHGEPRFPRYNTGPWFGLKPHEVIEATDTRDRIDFWFSDLPPETIPAGHTAKIPVPNTLAEIEVPAQPFAWQPQVHTTGQSVAVMTLPIVGEIPERESFWDAAEA